MKKGKKIKVAKPNKTDTTKQTILLDQTIQFVSAKKIKQKYDISNTTLQTWQKEGKVRCVRLPGGKRLYHQEDIDKFFDPNYTRDNNQSDTEQHKEEKKEENQFIIYARVSSAHQKKDLQRQIQFLQEKYPNHKVMSDIGSGINFHRPRFVTLLEQIVSGNVRQVVVYNRDRLCRFAGELIQWIFKTFNTKLLVHSETEKNQLLEENIQLKQQLEFADDLITVTNYFVAQNNGRRAQNKRREREQKNQGTTQSTQEQEEESTSTQRDENNTNQTSC